MKLERALELRRLIGSAGFYPQPDIKPANPVEDAEIKAMWKRMPGESCYYAVICRICKDLQDEECRRREFEEIDHRDIAAAVSMYDSLRDGTFYQKQEAAAASMGFTIKYIN